MSLELLAAAAVTAVAPYALKAAGSAAEKIGELSAETAAKVAGWLRDKLTGRAKESLERLETEPGNPDLATALKVDLSYLLKSDPALLAELRALIPAATVTDNQTQTITGDNNKAVQNKGDNNNISISG